MYRVRFEPKVLGFEMPTVAFRNKVKAALEAEGVQCGQWIDSLAGPNYPLFQQEVGSGDSLPWKEHQRGITCCVEDYPEAKAFIESSTELIGVPIAKSLCVVDMIADAFEKVWDNITSVLDIAI